MRDRLNIVENFSLELLISNHHRFLFWLKKLNELLNIIVLQGLISSKSTIVAFSQTLFLKQLLDLLELMKKSSGIYEERFFQELVLLSHSILK